MMTVGYCEKCGKEFDSLSAGRKHANEATEQEMVEHIDGYDEDTVYHEEFDEDVPRELKHVVRIEKSLGLGGDQ